MELRFDAAYRLTRDISLRAVRSSSTSVRALAAASTRADNSQDVIMYGFTMGVTWNR